MQEERQIGLTPLKRALVSGGLSGGLPMTYKVHNPRAPQRCGTQQQLFAEGHICSLSRFS